MDSEVIIVAVDASKEITDYALEWAFRNVTKAMDSLTILALLPCHRRPRPPSSANHLLSCLQRKWGFGDRDKVKNGSDDNGFNKTVQQDSFRRINNVCMQMMQQLCLSHDKQVHTQVKIVADAQLGAGATEARELEANWGCPLLERKVIDAIIDPQLKQNYEEKEVECMMYAASLCISPNPEKRSRMSKVLKILGDIPLTLACNYGQHSTSYLKQYANYLFVTESSDSIA